MFIHKIEKDEIISFLKFFLQYEPVYKIQMERIEENNVRINT